MKKVLVEIPPDAPFNANDLKLLWNQNASCVEAGDFVVPPEGVVQDFTGIEIAGAFVLGLTVNLTYDGLKLVANHYGWTLTKRKEGEVDVASFEPTK